jgi:hypothetical protein
MIIRAGQIKESLRDFARYYLFCVALSWMWLYNGGMFFHADGSFLDHPGIRGDAFASFLAAFPFALTWYLACRLLFFVANRPWPRFGWRWHR